MSIDVAIKLRLPIRPVLARQVRHDSSTFQPVLALAIQNVPLRSVAVQVQLRRMPNANLGPREVAVPGRKLVDLVLGDVERLGRIDRDELVLVEKQGVEADPPAALPLLEQEEETTVGLVVHLRAVKRESARNGDLHLADCAREVRVGLDRGPADAVHDVHEGRALCEPILGGLDELVDAALLP